MSNQIKNNNDNFVDKVDVAIDKALTRWGELSCIMEEQAVQRFHRTLPERQKEFWAVKDIQEWLKKQPEVPNTISRIPKEIIEKIRLLRKWLSRRNLRCISGYRCCDFSRSLRLTFTRCIHNHLSRCTQSKSR